MNLFFFYISEAPEATVRAPNPTAERLALFRPSRSRRIAYASSKSSKGRTWTANFVCLADRNMQKVPNSTEKTVLKAAGLGERKIQFQITDSEAEVHSKIISDNGFPQLCNAGGYEFLHCQSNCRQIEILKCRRDVENLKSAIGSQSKIYIRPIQKNLSTEPINPISITSERKEKCSSCSLDFCVSDLRQHVRYCIPPEFDHHDNEENIQETIQINNQEIPTEKR